MSRIKLLMALSCCCVLGIACQNDGGEVPGDQSRVSTSLEKASHGETAQQDIDWFDGSIEEAFAQAKAQGKPIYLYWGAVWCPPCHEIKATVFKSREFITRSRSFIPVYLDGDTENAQMYGEKFGVLGYPTMIVLTPEGEELTRIPGGSDIQAYANILDLALSESKSVSTLFTHVMEEGGTLSDSRCQMMAQYSWGQDTTILEGRDRAQVFLRLHDVCPQQQKGARLALMLNYLNEIIDAGEETGLSKAQQELGRAKVSELLLDYDTVVANVYAVMFDGAKYVAAFTPPGSPERLQLTQRFDAVYERIASDPQVFRTERIYANYGKIQFERIDDAEKELSPKLIDGIRKAVTEADEETTDAYERQTVMNAARNVLNEGGMVKEAKALLEKEITISKQPYYFMVGLADIEQEANNHDKAIYWLARAYDEARGPATRFQWGVYYVTGLLEMTPENTSLIEEQTLKLIAELAENQAMYQRPRKQLSRLEAKLKSWREGGDYAESFSNIQRGVMKICSTISESEPSRDTCDAFLTSG